MGLQGAALHEAVLGSDPEDRGCDSALLPWAPVMNGPSFFESAAAPDPDPGHRDSSPKYVFVTGGVVSSLGKGIAAASLGRLLKSRGLRVVNQKLDPYINVDPGTMNPLQHGEVFVTDDGGETDLDLGHYERFTGENLRRLSNVTAGSVYLSVIQKERRGDYLGDTVQVIPHVTNEIKARIQRVGEDGDVDVVITEVGGTVGDIEGLPFLEAIRQFGNEIGRANVLFAHVTLVPYLSTSEELKTKPTQHSVAELRSHGIHPDVIIVRSDREIDDGVRRKISLFCDVEERAVIPAPDAEDIYQVPLMLRAGGLDDVVCDRLGIVTGPARLDTWAAMVERATSASEPVTVGIVGKYVALPDAYLSVAEALRHGAAAHERSLDLRWIPSEDITGLLADSYLSDLDAIVVPGGFGYRGVEGKIETIRYAREHDVPFLGLCLGLQCAVIEFSRSVLGLSDAHSTEFDSSTKHPVIDLMASQHDVEDMGGTMRLGLYAAKLAEGSKIRALYGQELVYERHRHRWEVNNRYRKDLESAGMRLSGLSPDDHLVEFIELIDHPYFVATQAHPELRSRPDRPHPLFAGLIEAAARRRDGGDVRVEVEAAEPLEAQ
jgi:CTP synthase